MTLEELLAIVSKSDAESATVMAEIGRKSIYLKKQNPITSPSKYPTYTEIGSFWGDIDEETFERFGEALLTNTDIQSLTILNYRNVSDSEAAVLAKVLLVHPKLKTLILRENNLSTQGVESLASALAVNKTLTALTITSNYVVNDGLKALSNALVLNTSLTKLDLTHNWIDCKGAMELSTALIQNTTLKSLFIGQNKIGHDGMLALLSAVEHNSTLRELEHGYGNLDINGPTLMTAFSNKLKQNEEQSLFQTKLNFLFGLHDRIGQDSSLRTLKQSGVFDKSNLGLVFSYIDPIKHSKAEWRVFITKALASFNGEDEDDAVPTAKARLLD